MTLAAGAGKKSFTSIRLEAITCCSHSMNARIERGRNGSTASAGSAVSASASAACARATASRPPDKKLSRSPSSGRWAQRPRAVSSAIRPPGVIRSLIIETVTHADDLVKYDCYLSPSRRQRPARDLCGVPHGEAEEAEDALGVVDVGVRGRLAVEGGP